MINTIYDYVPFFRAEALTSTQLVQPNDLVFFLKRKSGSKTKKKCRLVWYQALTSIQREECFYVFKLW